MFFISLAIANTTYLHINKLGNDKINVKNRSFKTLTDLKIGSNVFYTTFILAGAMKFWFLFFSTKYTLIKTVTTIQYILVESTSINYLYPLKILFEMVVVNCTFSKAASIEFSFLSNTFCHKLHKKKFDLRFPQTTGTRVISSKSLPVVEIDKKW